MKRTMIFFLAVVIVISASGCSSSLSSEYSSITVHEEDNVADISQSSDYIEVSDYSTLTKAILSLVSSVTDTGVIRFTNYDGDVESDLSEACLEVYRDTAIGSYAVDYMSHSITRIISYYEAEINITYRRTAEQISGIQNISNTSSLSELLTSTVSELENYIAFQTSSLDIDEEYITSWLADYFTSNPFSTMAAPAVAVNIYPETGVQHIIEVNLEYSYTSEEIFAMKREIVNTVAEIIGTVNYRENSEYDTVMEIIQSLLELTSTTQAQAAENDSLYNLIVNGFPGALGFAQSFSFISDICGLDCIIVTGLKNGSVYYWNIVKIDGICYHVDVFDCYTSGTAEDLLKSDQDMVQQYTWDRDSYPACETDFQKLA